MELLHRKFTVTEVAEITGASKDSIKNWTKQKVIVNQRQIEGGGEGPGHYRRYSFSNVMEIATAAALLDGGARTVAEAFQSASEFSHGGDNERVPPLPFHHSHGQTILVAAGGRGSVILRTGTTFTLSNYERRFLRNPIIFSVVDVTRIFKSICGRLDLHPYEVLDQAYPNEATG